jgi:hypothetical protein
MMAEATCTSPKLDERSGDQALLGLDLNRAYSSVDCDRLVDPALEIASRADSLSGGWSGNENVR